MVDQFITSVSPEQVKEARRYPLLRLLPADTRLIPKGKGKYMLNCTMPGHEDPNPSMSLRRFDDGCWRYFCFGCQQSGDPIQYLQATKGATFMEAVSELSKAAHVAPPKPREVCRYNYRDLDGSVLYQVVRYEPKDFRVCRPAPDGAGCIWNLQGVKRVLYSRPVDTYTGDVWYVEGEKDADTCRLHGLFATTHAGGASSWRDELLEQIPKCCRLILVPDMDDPGKQLMRRIWNAAQNRGQGVHFVLLPKGKDVTEFFELGGTVQELTGLIT